MQSRGGGLERGGGGWDGQRTTTCPLADSPTANLHLLFVDIDLSAQCPRHLEEQPLLADGVGAEDEQRSRVELLRGNSFYGEWEGRGSGCFLTCIWPKLYISIVLNEQGAIVFSPSVNRITSLCDGKVCCGEQ